MNNILGIGVLGFLLLSCVVIFFWCLELCINRHLKFFENKVKMNFDNAYYVSVLLTSLEFAAGFYVASLFIKVSV